jgi:hypothetical protein
VRFIGIASHALSFGQHLGILEADIAVKSVQSGEPLIACANVISARDLDHLQESRALAVLTGLTGSAV